ncbi:uncharacterized protein LOC114518591 [Dendronephthya gigantea]|uniref:uncharacterized protein LOC114518591 n=1 Tax=Dendronephthya gigantea TaxID=151771 RepID=UPI0010699B60|nr:uncharacterized protein LOC114518591 [Dendronephthya gigantea]
MRSFWTLVLLMTFYVAAVSTSVLSRQGLCPFVYESDHNCQRKIDFECLLDFDCSDSMKCCRTACRQYKCIQPLRNRVCRKKSDIAFVLDASGSIGEESFKNMKNTIEKLLESFSHEKGYRHAAIVYGQTPRIVFNNIATQTDNLKTDELVNMIKKVPYYKTPMTRIIAALRLVQQEIFLRNKNQDDRIKMIVLFTDGVQSIPPYQEGLVEAGKVLDSQNIKVFGILTGEQRNMDGLLSLCTNDGFIFEPDFLQELIKVMNHETEYYC